VELQRVELSGIFFLGHPLLPHPLSPGAASIWSAPLFPSIYSCHNLCLVVENDITGGPGRKTTLSLDSEQLAWCSHKDFSEKRRLGQ
jgi:hypothetical protein